MRARVLTNAGVVSVARHRVGPVPGGVPAARPPAGRGAPPRPLPRLVVGVAVALCGRLRSAVNACSRTHQRWGGERRTPSGRSRPRRSPRSPATGRARSPPTAAPTIGGWRGRGTLRAFAFGGECVLAYSPTL